MNGLVVRSSLDYEATRAALRAHIATRGTRCRGRAPWRRERREWDVGAVWAAAVVMPVAGVIILLAAIWASPDPAASSASRSGRPEAVTATILRDAHALAVAPITGPLTRPIAPPATSEATPAPSRPQVTAPARPAAPAPTPTPVVSRPQPPFPATSSPTAVVAPSVPARPHRHPRTSTTPPPSTPATSSSTRPSAGPSSTPTATPG